MLLGLLGALAFVLGRLVLEQAHQGGDVQDLVALLLLVGLELWGFFCFFFRGRGGVVSGRRFFPPGVFLRFARSKLNRLASSGMSSGPGVSFLRLRQLAMSVGLVCLLRRSVCV